MDLASPECWLLQVNSDSDFFYRRSSAAKIVVDLGF
jgi:hypothetical protein